MRCISSVWRIRQIEFQKQAYICEHMRLFCVILLGSERIQIISKTCVHAYIGTVLARQAVVRMYARTVTFKFFRNIRRYKKWQHSMQL